MSNLGGMYRFKEPLKKQQNQAPTNYNRTNICEYYYKHNQFLISTPTWPCDTFIA